MITNILTAEATYNYLGVNGPEDYAAAHLASLREKAKRKIFVEPHVVNTPLEAYVNHGRWIGDCHCHAGIALHPAWSEGRCFGCGAIYAHVAFPADWIDVERALVVRPALDNRNWRAPETVADLLAENQEHL